MKWIIENFTDSEDYNDLIKAVKDQGHDCYVIGRRNNFDFNPEGYQENDCVLFQGSIQMTRHIRTRLPRGCYPIAFCTEENFLCSKYYPYVGQFLFNDRHAITTVAELKADPFTYYSRFGKEAMIYIRPDRGDKPFSGQLLDMQDFQRFWENNIVCTAEDKDLVIVSTPKQINGEWRFVCSSEPDVIRPDIIAYSTYQYQGKRTYFPGAPQGAIDLVRKVLDVGYHPDPVFVVDVCEDADGNFWLLEFNSFSSAGLYGMKKDDVVGRVSMIAQREYYKQKAKL